MKNKHNLGKRNKVGRVCYMCDQEATSKEHVPPVCLFPEEKDIKTSVFRNNLITVPSCNLHNSKKSKDDEFLMACLAGIVGNNIIGFFHNLTKVKRALDRKGIIQPHILFSESQKNEATNNNNNVLPVPINEDTFNRLASSFQHIAFGLYFHKFGNGFKGECQVIMDFINYTEDKSEQLKLLCRKRFEMEPIKPKVEGLNPEIFKYEFIDPDEFGLIALKMTFYEGATVFIAFRKETIAKPFNLVTELINSGIKTVVSFDDGIQFEFN